MAAGKRMLLATATPAKAMNLLLLFASYQWSRLLGKPLHRGMPASISIEPTTTCNLRCPECTSGLRQFTRPQGNMKMETFRTVIDQLGSKLLFLNLYFQGEPFIHPEFLQMVEYAAGKNIYTCTSTNGHFISGDVARQTVRSGLNRLIVSMDGATQQVYEQYRKGGRLDKVLTSIKELVQQRALLGSKTPHIVLQCLVTRGNEAQLNDIKRIGRDAGVDEVKFKTLQVYDYEKGNHLLPTKLRYSRYKNTGTGHYRIENMLGNGCWRMWSSCVVTWDGKLLPCCFDKDANYCMGNALHTDLAHIWRNSVYHAFRMSVLSSRKSVDICTNCSEGSKIWI